MIGLGREDNDFQAALGRSWSQGTDIGQPDPSGQPVVDSSNCVVERRVRAHDLDACACQSPKHPRLGTVRENALNGAKQHSMMADDELRTLVYRLERGLRRPSKTRHAP